MKRPIVLAAATLPMFGGPGAIAGTTATPAAAQSTTAQTVAARTTSFTIRNMTCALCPITVRMAMAGVAGVKSATMDFDAKTATVIFDASVTNPDATAAASTILKTGILGSVVAATCCVTPALVVALGSIGLSTWVGWLDYVLLPSLAVFLGMTACGLVRRNRANACCGTDIETNRGEN